MVDPDKILEELAHVRDAGFAVSDQETVTGLRVLAAAITDIDGVPVAAMSVAAPAFGRSLEEFIAEARDATCAAAAKLSSAVRAAGATAVQHRVT
jgi:IclR family pca regulon transcriptional regulator